MDRWVGKVAVVTGASAGIGAATAIGLVKAGLKVVGLARRVEMVEELRKEIPADAKGSLFAYKCDVSSETDIKAAFSWIIQKFGGVDVLVNNAGVFKSTTLSGTDDAVMLQQTLDTNVMGTVLCTRQAYQSMKKRGVAGHVFIVNSVAGHTVPFFPDFTSFNMYPASKYALTAITEVLRQEFISDGTKVKVTVHLFDLLFCISFIYVVHSEH